MENRAPTVTLDLSPFGRPSGTRGPGLLDRKTPIRGVVQNGDRSNVTVSADVRREHAC